MRDELVARLRKTLRGEPHAQEDVTDVTDVTGVTDVTVPLGLRLEPQELRQLRQLRLEIGNAGSSANEGVTGHVTESSSALDLDAVEERAALAADCVPADYLYAWALLQCLKPPSIGEAEWRQAIDDGGRFLDAWGQVTVRMGWTAGELLKSPQGDQPVGLVWQLNGERVEQIGADYVVLGNRRTCTR